MLIFIVLAMTKLLVSGEMAVAMNTWYNIMLQISVCYSNSIVAVVGVIKNS